MRLAMIISDIPDELPEQTATVSVLDGHFPMQNSVAFGLYTDSAEEETIFIITGIAEDRAWITLAHELTHFWQKRNCPNPQDLALLEGFAEWTAYKLAEHHELYRAMLSMRRNVAEPYHTGLHTLLALEQKLGVQGVIQFARTETGWN